MQPSSKPKQKKQKDANTSAPEQGLSSTSLFEKGAVEEKLSEDGLKIPLRFMETWRLEVNRRQAKELDQYAKRSLENFAQLRQTFAEYSVDYLKEILPFFAKTFQEVLWILSCRQAMEVTVREYRRWLKRYEGPTRVLTAKDSPFPDKLQQQLKNIYSRFAQPSEIQTMLLKAIRENSWETYGARLLDQNIKKSPYKHPIWKQLQFHLFSVLTQRGISKRKTYGLIAQLFKTLIPHWFDVKYSEDAIRLMIQSYKSRKR